jgi:predicted MFS family arabinose efflux permease
MHLPFECPQMLAALRAKITPVRLVLIVCTAQVCVQVGAYVWPALLPGMMDRWSLSNSEAGWITGLFYAAYTVAVPVLVTLTDRVDAKRVYLCGVALTVAAHLFFALFADGFWSAALARVMAGIGWAGTYMTGLKLLADRVEGRLMARAVSGHAAGVGVAGALSFVIADLVSGAGGWQAAFAVGAGTAALAWLVVAVMAPPRAAPPERSAGSGRLFDFRPVFRNRSAMAYALAYCFHTWEMNALRGWGVAFLTFVAVSTGDANPWIAPPVVVTAMGLIGTGASIFGNEMSIRLGRMRLIRVAITGSVVVGAVIGFLGPLSYALAAVLVLAYGFVIWLDSSSLTAGAAGSADPARRGATLAVHSMLGYGGGFVGPLVIGWTLDLAGGMSRVGWGMAYLIVAMLVLASLVLFTRMNPRDIEGDRGRSKEA